MKEKIEKEIKNILEGFGITEEVSFLVEHPNDLRNGDYSTNVAMIVSKKTGENLKQVAEKIVAALKTEIREAEKIETTESGFINFYLSKKFFEEVVKEIINVGENYGLNDKLQKQKTIIEFTDPNPFKEFHIGHMMSNTIGEALSRITEANGAVVKRMVYQGDIGLHIAKAVWGMVQNRTFLPRDEDSLERKVEFLAKAYSFGSREYDSGEETKKEIIAINKLLFEKTSEELNLFYERGRQWSLEKFETIYERLGTKFDYQILESEIVDLAESIVRENLEKGIFEISEGAIVYKGEKVGLHTRVFLNSEGLPVYEAKELALANAKNQLYKYDKSVVVTGNEINEYFKVVLVAMKEIYPYLESKTVHVSHGMLRLPTGKMGSRTGDVISTESLIDNVKSRIIQKIEEAGRDFNEEEKDKIAEDVAIGAIKYSILKQSSGKDIIFDFDKSLSFEGDSGPYLQYTTLRAKSIWKNAEQMKRGIASSELAQPENWEITEVEKILNRFPEVIENSYKDLAPQHLVRYLTDLAAAFNNFYASGQIISDEPDSDYRIRITFAVNTILENGIKILGIRLPERM
jgi:arginyl-tRNA synthetase